MHTRAHVPRHIRAYIHGYGPRVCEAFWALSRNAEWVMHPAQARGRQMNYNISFSRPYIPTDKAYWRGLIAFNSLLVHPCNGSRTKGHTFSPLRSLFCLFLFLPSIPESPFCPLRAFPSPSPPVDPQTSPRCRDYYYCSLFSLLFLCDDAIV